MNSHRILTVLFALAAFSLSAESLRGPVLGEVTPDGQPVSAGLGDLVPVTLPGATKFTRALEIEIDIPREVFPVRSGLAVVVYQNFQPGKEGSDPTGDRIATEVLPPASKFYLEAPLVPKAGLKAAVDTAILKVGRSEDSFPLAVSIQAISKDLDADLSKVQFVVRTRLVNGNLGSLVLVTPGLSDDDRKKLKITANGIPQGPEGPLFLEPGPYTLTVTLPGIDTATQTVVVTQAKETDVLVNLATDEPTLVIEAPEGTQVVIDGKRLYWKPSGIYPIDRGVHTVQFVIGNTVVSDDFTVNQGGRHRLILNLSISLKQD